MRSNLKQNVAVLLVMAMAMIAAPAMAQVVVPPAIESGIEDGVTLIGLVIAIGGLGFITIASAGVAWNVGAKFIKRLGGKA